MDKEYSLKTKSANFDLVSRVSIYQGNFKPSRNQDHRSDWNLFYFFEGHFVVSHRPPVTYPSEVVPIAHHKSVSQSPTCEHASKRQFIQFENQKRTWTVRCFG